MKKTINKQELKLLLEKKLKTESKLVKNDSMKMLREFEAVCNLYIGV